MLYGYSAITNSSPDNMGKRKELDDSTCMFCAEQKLISHLFFKANVVWRLKSGKFALKFYLSMLVLTLNLWEDGGLVGKNMLFLTFMHLPFFGACAI
jgi:hypothetical protein